MSLPAGVMDDLKLRLNSSMTPADSKNLLAPEFYI
jgi:hypothetical protein